jgi:hypothetical protein
MRGVAVRGAWRVAPDVAGAGRGGRFRQRDRDKYAAARGECDGTCVPAGSCDPCQSRSSHNHMLREVRLSASLPSESRDPAGQACRQAPSLACSAALSRAGGRRAAGGRALSAVRRGQIAACRAALESLASGSASAEAAAEAADPTALAHAGRGGAGGGAEAVRPLSKGAKKNRKKKAKKAKNAAAGRGGASDSGDSD